MPTRATPVEHADALDWLARQEPNRATGPAGWGSTRRLVDELERLGCHVEEWRVLGRSVLVIT